MAAPTPGIHSRHNGRIAASVFYLSRFLLLSLALLFAGMIAGLEVLNYFSNRDHGLVAAAEDQHYLWTYGPTLVLTGVAAIWGQVEYYAVQLMPWLLLKSGSAARGNNGLLLDYLTPLSLVSLISSAKHRHFPVTFGILGGLILKGLVIISTGLLVLETQQFTGPTNFTVMSDFNLSLIPTAAEVVDVGITIWSINNQSASFPPGTGPTFNTQLFKPSDADINTSLEVSANLSVFEAVPNCQTFEWVVDTALVKNNSKHIEDYLPEEDIDQLAPYCILGTSRTVDTEFGTFISGGSDRIQTIHTLDLCPGQAALDEGDSHRLFFPFRYDLSATETGVSALLCRPSYSITRRQVTTAGAGTSISQDVIAVSDSILSNASLGIQPVQITAGIQDSFRTVLLNAVGAGSADQYNQANAWYSIMNLTFPASSLQVYRNVSYFRDAFESVYKSTAAQAVNTLGMALLNATIPGTIVYVSARLVVINVSLRLMEALLAVMIITSIGLCFYDYSEFPGNPGALIMPASVLSRSDDLKQLLSGTGSGNLEDLRRTLDGHHFKSMAQGPAGAMQINVETESKAISSRAEVYSDVRSGSGWWVPGPLTVTYKFGLICLALGFVVILEVLLRLSEDRSGILAVSTDRYYEYGWLFLPTFLLSCVSLAFGAVATGAKLLHPYQELQRRRANNDDAILFDPSGRTTLASIPHALRRKYWGLSAAMFLSILGPVLPIAASGLFTAEIIPGAEPVDVALFGWFDLSNATTADGIALMNSDSALRAPSTDAVLNMAIQFNNLSYPRGTYAEFAFAEIDDNSLLPLLGSANTSSTTLQARLPAVRGELNCTAWPVNNSTETIQSLSSYGYVPAVFVPVAIPTGCTYDVSNSSNPVLGLLRQGGDNSPKEGYFGYWADTRWLSLNDTNSFGYRGPFDVCNDARQHLFFFYGRNANVSLNSRLPATADQLDVLHCMPFLQAMYVDTTLKLPSLVVDPTAPPPKVVDGSIMMWDSNNASANTLPYPGLPSAVNLDFNIEGIFAALIRGYQGQPAEEIIGGRNTTRMIDSLNQLFRQMVAQSLHFNYRTPLPSPAVSDRRRADKSNAFGTTSLFVDGPATGNLLDGTQRRLVQNEVSTRFLIALLLALALCTLFVCIFGWDTNVVPKNPGSLGGRLSLFADGNILGRIKEHENSSANDTLLVPGESFALTWWHRKGEKLLHGSEKEMYYGIGIWGGHVGKES